MALDSRIITGQSDALQGPDALSLGPTYATAVQVTRRLEMIETMYAIVMAGGVWTSSVAGDRLGLIIQDGNGGIVSNSELLDTLQEADRHQPWSVIAAIPRNLNGPPPASVRPAIRFRRLAGSGRVVVSRSQIFAMTLLRTELETHVFPDQVSGPFPVASLSPSVGFTSGQLLPAPTSNRVTGMILTCDLTAPGVGHILSLRATGATNPGARQNIFSQAGGIPVAQSITLPTTDGSFEYEMPIAGSTGTVRLVAWIER